MSGHTERMSEDDLDGEQMDEVIGAYVAIESDNPSEEETFGRLVALFNRIYAMGQQHERSAREAGSRSLCLHHWHVYAQTRGPGVAWDECRCTLCGQVRRLPHGSVG